MAQEAFKGLKVIEYGNLVSAPYCTKLLADLGAEVIKVEKPGTGDKARYHGPFPNDEPHPERSGLFLILNTNKLGITLNVETATGRDILVRLLQDADVFVENNAPQDMEKLGLDYDSLEKINPHMIMASITPFGQFGPYRDYKAYDINCCAAGGVSIGIGHPDREPLVLPLSQGGYQAGVSAVSAILIALIAREKTGEGQHVDISEVENWGTLHVGESILTFLYRGITGVRRGIHGGYFLYPCEILPCKDGYLSFNIVQLAQWTRFLELMGTPEWTKNPRYRDRRAMNEQYPDEANALWAPWLMERTREEVFQLCLENRIPVAPVYTISEVVNHPHLKERNFFIERNHPEAGKLKYPEGPCQFSEINWLTGHAAPLLGEHNRQILQERLGYSDEELADLERAEVV